MLMIGFLLLITFKLKKLMVVDNHMKLLIKEEEFGIYLKIFYFKWKVLKIL